MKKILLFSFLLYFSTASWRLAGVVLYQFTGSGSLASMASNEALRQPWMLAFLLLLALALILYFRDTEPEARGWELATALLGLAFLWQGLSMLFFQESLLQLGPVLARGPLLAAYAGLALFWLALFLRGGASPAALVWTAALGYALAAPWAPAVFLCIPPQFPASIAK